MKLYNTHPNPDLPLFTIFLVEDTGPADVKFYGIIPRATGLPDSKPLWTLYDEFKQLIAIQTLVEPKVLNPAKTKASKNKIPKELGLLPPYSTLKHYLRNG